MKSSIETLRKHFSANGQAHLCSHWERLDDAGRRRLEADLTALAPDLESLLAAQVRAVKALQEPNRARLEPPEVIALPDPGSRDARRESARERGGSLLAAGRIAAMVVAGGQGTRLGFQGPKGNFPVGPVSQRNLFALQAQKIAGLTRRCGRPIPWYVMTSAATDVETRLIFEQSAHFGLRPEDVFIFPQGMVPAFDFEGRILQAGPDQLAMSPDGHGGALTALNASGALDDMERRGVDTIFYYQVDNPLIKICDPEFLGLHDAARAEMSCKVIRKRDPDAKWGVVARVDGQLSMVEYTELDSENRHARDASGELVFWAGNPAIHVIGRDFVRRVADSAAEFLPFHASAKKIPCIDERGRPLDPEEPNGYKLERFVFDALPVAERVCLVETSQREEFSPIKNASGPESPETARNALSDLYRSWLSEAGLDLPREGALVEIDHSLIDSAEELNAAGFESRADAGNLIRTTTGSRP